ncbi:MAG: hypothetical protein KatS3mg076_0460 [Candidatus Binatia bacterium]|nr:MAG: hypothetical protein KatS3mg076_0460 [Candidatus Binatia bacterium]
MKSEQYASFLSAIGHRVVRTESGLWYDAARYFLLGAPSHELREPPPEELRKLLVRGGFAGARYTAPLHAKGRASYQIVCDDRDYSLEKLSANTRSKVRRGLRRCEIAPLSAEEARRHGYEAHRDTVVRQGRQGDWGRVRWDLFWDAVARTPDVEVRGAWVGNELAAFLVCLVFEDSAEFSVARSRTDALGAYPNNALVYRTLHEMLHERGLREVTFGIESLEPVGPLDEFKFSMGFRPRPIRQAVVFHPAVSLLLRRSSFRRLARAVARRGSESRGPSAFWRKAVGLLAFAEEGGTV